MLLDDSVILHEIHVAERRAESMLFKMIEKFRMRKNREFFDCPLEKIKEFMETVKSQCEKTETFTAKKLKDHPVYVHADASSSSTTS